MEIMIQSEEDHKDVALLQELVKKLTLKFDIYTRQIHEQVRLPRFIEHFPLN